MPALNVQTSGSLSTYLMTYLQKEFLTILRNTLLLHKWGKKKRLAKGQGSTINWRRWSDLSDATTALTEGTSPSGAALTLNSVTGTLAQYGKKIFAVLKLSLIYQERLRFELCS